MDRGRPFGTARPPRHPHHPTDADRDLALGEKVPRCAVCGMPCPDFLVGRWSVDGKAYRIGLCGHCLGVDKQPEPGPADRGGVRDLQ